VRQLELVVLGALVELVVLGALVELVLKRHRMRW
jgi:hypothetical protein